MDKFDIPDASTYAYGVTMQLRSRARTHTHTHTHARTRTHTHTHARTRTHTHAHTPGQVACAPNTRSAHAHTSQLGVSPLAVSVQELLSSLQAIYRRSEGPITRARVSNSDAAGRERRRAALGRRGRPRAGRPAQPCFPRSTCAGRDARGGGSRLGIRGPSSSKRPSPGRNGRDRERGRGGERRQQADGRRAAAKSNKGGRAPSWRA
jgi:hypothetical protein